MENEQLVLGLLESVLGKGKPDKNKKDHAFHCPICNHKKPKLIVNIFTGQYNCWTCHPATKGKTPVSLFKKLGVDKSRLVEMKSYFANDRTKIEDAMVERIFLPKEFISMTENDKSLEYRHAAVYLKNRGINESDVRKYNIGYCKTGSTRNTLRRHIRRNSNKKKRHSPIWKINSKGTDVETCGISSKNSIFGIRQGCS